MVGSENENQEITSTADMDANVKASNTDNRNHEAAIDKHRASLNVQRAQLDIKEAEEVWHNLDNGIPTPASSEDRAVSNVKLSEALSFYEGKDLDEYQKSIKPLKRLKGIQGFIQRICTIVKKQGLDASLHPARDFVFKVALCPLEEESTICPAMLKTVYRRIVGSGVDCPRYGNHWEQLGFQGFDPATDLRGCGMLGLLHVLNLCEEPNLNIGRKIYALSRHQTQNFPFCLMSINITSIVLQAMRDQVFNKELNTRHSEEVDSEKLVGFFNSVCEFHLAVFYHLYKTWKNEGKTMANSGYVLEDLKKHTKKFSKQMIKNLQQNSSG